MAIIRHEIIRHEIVRHKAIRHKATRDKSIRHAVILNAIILHRTLRMTAVRPHFLDAPGELSRLVAEHDWASTALGPQEAWPDGLKAALQVMLSSRFEMWLGWGAGLSFFYNDAYVPTLGMKHPAALGRPMKEVWKEVFADVEDRIVSVMCDGVATWDKALMLLLERNGYPEETYHTFSYSPIRGASGAVEGLMCVVTEETERVISERRLATSLELSTSLLSARTYRDVKDAVDRTLKNNRRDFPFGFLHLFDEAPGDDPVEQAPWPADKAAESAERILVSLEDFPVALPKGAWSIAPRHAVVLPIARANAGKPVAALVLGLNPYRSLVSKATDIEGLLVGQISGALAGVETTLTRRAEAERLRQLFEQSPSFIAVLRGPDHRFEMANPGYLQLIGHRSVVGMTVRDALPELEGQGFYELLDRVFSTGQPYRGSSVPVLLQRSTDGAPENRYLDFVYQPIIESGAVTGIFVEGIDVTSSHDVAAALANLNANLEEKVTERTKALIEAEEALRQSQKMEAVGQLTGGIAHDFNNLLAGISGSLELLERRLTEGRYTGLDRYITGAQGSTRRAAALTQRLLAFSRRQTLDPKPIDVNRLIGGLEELIRRTIGPSNELEVIGAGGLWLTKVDHSQLESALLNLCINARDAMPNGGRMTIETANKWLDERAARERDLKAGQYVSLCVTDTGTGMSPDIVDHIFEPFFTTKPIGEGTGLGLSMIHGFVRQSGGQVRVYSEVGKGTTMCLYLPRFIGTLDEAAESEFADALDQGHGETVLVIDDEATIRMLMTEVLEEAGYRVLQCSDGPSGLKLLQSNTRVDLLVTDVGLPGGMNGRQIADAARISRRDLKVLFITGYAENAAVGNGLLDPGMEVLAKPFTMVAFGNKVRDMIER